MAALFWLVDQIIGIYIWVLIAAAVFSMLTSFGVLDTRNRLVWTIGDFLYRITEPALAPIRRFLPNTPGLDLAPLVVFIAIIILQQALRNNAGFFYGF